MRTTIFSLALGLTLAACGPSPAVRHAQTLVDRGDYRGASDYTAAELGKRPDDAGLHRVRLRALLGLGDAAGAIADYRAWRERAGGADDRPALKTMALTTLWQGLRAPSVALKVAAIRAIEANEVEALAEDVGRAMGDDHDQVAAAAAVAVLRAYPQAPEVATQMLGSDDPVARAIAVEGIGRKIKGLAADDLRPLASDGDPRVRAAVATYLAGLGDAADTARLITLAGDADAIVRASALRALAARDRSGATGLAELATRGLADEQLPVRLAAVELRKRVGGAAALADLAGHADPMVALAAARGAGDRAAAAAAIDRALASGELAIRLGGVHALTALGKDAARSRAAGLVGDAAPEVRIAAARALAYAGDGAAAIAALAPIATDAGAALKLRADAAAELHRLGDGRGRATLATLASAEPEAGATLVAAHVAAGVITPGLWSALADDQAATRIAAAAALLALL